MSLLSFSIFLGTLVYSFLIKRLFVTKVYKYAVFTSVSAYFMASVFYNKFILVILCTAISYMSVSIARTSNKKIISLVSEGALRRKAYSYSFGVLNFGAAFAAIISPLLYNANINNMRYIYFINASFYLISYLVLTKFMPKIDKDTIESEKIKTNKSIKELMDYKMLLAIAGLYFGMFQIVFLIPKSIEANYSILAYSLFLILNSAICLLASMLTPIVFAKKNEFTALNTAGIAILLSLMLYTIVDLPLLIVSTLIFSVGEVLLITNLDSYLLKLYTNEEYDKALVITRLCAMTARTISPLFAAIIIHYASFQLAYILVAFIVLMAILLLYSFERKKNLTN